MEKFNTFYTWNLVQPSSEEFLGQTYPERLLGPFATNLRTEVQIKIWSSEIIIQSFSSHVDYPENARAIQTQNEQNSYR